MIKVIDVRDFVILRKDIDGERDVIFNDRIKRMGFENRKGILYFIWNGEEHRLFNMIKYWQKWRDKKLDKTKENMQWGRWEEEFRNMDVRYYFNNIEWLSVNHNPCVEGLQTLSRLYGFKLEGIK